MNYYETTKNTKVPVNFLEVYKEKCKADFIKTSKSNDITYFEKIPTKWIKEGTQEAINNSRNRDNKTIIVLEPHYETLVEEILKQILFLLVALFLQIGFGLLFTSKSIISPRKDIIKESNETP